PASALAAPPLPAEPVRWARAPVTVATADISDVQLPLSDGFTLSGRAVFTGAAALAPDIAGAQLRPDPAIPSSAPPSPVHARLRTDRQGRMASMGVAPGRYFLRVGTVPRGLTLVSALTGGHDALDEPIDVHDNIDDLTLTFDSRPLGSIAGTVTRQTPGS